MPRYCTRCVLPDTRPGVALDAEGVCNGCRNAERKLSIDWNRRRDAFVSLTTKLNAPGPYDCVIPVSGGKDSFWQVVTCLDLGLKPLCVTYVYPGRTELGERNLRSLVGLGVDHLELRVNPDVERRFVRRAFVTTATSGLVSHMAIYAWPLQIAVAHGIPLVVYGENSAFEFGSEDETLVGSRVDTKWLAAFGVTGGTTASDWIDTDLSTADLAPYFVPEPVALEGVHAVFLGHFFPWDPENSVAVARRHGFESRAEGPRVGHYDYVNIDDDMIGAHHHAKWFKYGITRSFDTLSMEIRAGRLTRDDAIATLTKLGDETPWADIGAFCDYVGLTQAEYFGVLERFRNPEIWSRDGGTWRIDGFLIPDFDWAAVCADARE